jgi:hypothetical protein
MSSVCDGKDTIISKVKVFAKAENTFIFQNALTQNGVNVEFGGALIKNTDVTGGYQLNLGTTLSRLTQLNLRGSNQVLLDYTNGGQGVSLLLNASGLIVSDTLTNPKGLTGAADYSANYTALSYIQKGYADGKLLGKNISATLQNPTNSEDGFVMVWDDGNQEFTLISVGSISAGADTQVIYNDGGALVGIAGFTFNKTTKKLTVTDIDFGVDTVTAGTERVVEAKGSSGGIGIRFITKGVNPLALETNVLEVGTAVKPFFGITQLAPVANSGFFLEGKGEDAVIWIGGSLFAGGYRRLQAQSSASNARLLLQGWGTSGVAIGNADNSDLELGTVLWTGTKRTLFALSSEANVDLALAPKGVNRKVLIGSSTIANTAPIIEPDSSNANCDLILQGKGTGVVYVNGIGHAILQIGDWNMFSDGTKLVPHGLGANWQKVRTITVLIRRDDDIEYRMLSGEQNINLDSTNIGIGRSGTSTYAVSPNYQSLSFNRGWIYLTLQQ